MATTDRVAELVLPVLESLQLSLYDVELAGGTLRVTVQGAGVDLDDLAVATREISRVLDEHEPMPGSYTLEVSSPGLERRLRIPEHFAGAVGELVNVKLGPQVEGPRRIRGTLEAADGERVTVVDEAGHRHVIAVADITKAATVFEWGPPPKPGRPGAKRSTDDPDRPERRAATR